MTTTDTTTPLELVYLDPAKIVTDSNIRSKLGSLKALTESISEVGVLVPLIVSPLDDGTYKLVAGARRRAAAIKAGVEVPCFVKTSDDDAFNLAMQMTENTNREPLSALDEARGFQQLEAFGMDVKAIARATGRDQATVKAGLTAAASVTATKAAKNADLTLAHLAVLAEFEGDTERVRRLTEIATERPGDFEHMASRYRDERERDRLHDEKAKELADKGITVVASLGWGYEMDRPVALTYLRAPKTTDALTVKQHDSCEGHVARVSISHDMKVGVDYGCANPKKYGHLKVGSNDEQTKKSTEDRAKTIAGNKEWRAAEKVRLEFVANLLKRKTAPAGTVEVVAALTLGKTIEPHRSDKLLGQLMGWGEGKGWSPNGERIAKSTITKQNAPMLLLAQTAAHVEKGMGVHTWQNGSKDAAVWLTFLASCGYTLSDIEQRVTKRAKT